MSHAGESGLDKPKPAKRKINGVLLLNKPYGITSNRALQIVKRLFSAAKSGHTGTLDPMATGLLPICFGEATKFSSMLLSADKTYQATVKLGYTSSTGDADGEISVVENPGPIQTPLKPDELEKKLQNFTGSIKQIPPMHSALKYQGKPLYSYARKGIEIKRQPRDIIIHDLKIDVFVGNELQITVKCGTGTYIRTLAEDIGKALGYGGAYLSKLCRCAINDFDLSQAYSLDTLERKLLNDREACLYSTDYLLKELQAVNLDAQSTTSILQGRTILDHPAVYQLSAGEKIRLYDCERRFLGLGEISAEGKIIPKRLMSAN
jgi:tRNA pseudouridine55 synthase